MAWLLVLSSASLHGQAPTRPFDPLTPAERAAAERIARSDSGVHRLLGGRPADIATIQLFVPKPPDDGRPLTAHVNGMGRSADLVLSTLEGPHVGVWVRVDTRAGRVEDVRQLTADSVGGSIRVPFAPREVERAGALVRASEEGRRRLGADAAGWVLEYRPVGGGDLGQPCFRNRCVAVLFRRDRTYLRSYALVNLETSTVAFRDGVQ
ncbi:MAG TPA: hypothetical protein VF584_20000 [Longimicrobium sp.]|jgi:hypothetical protein